MYDILYGMTTLKRTTIMLDPEVFEELREIAWQRKVTLGQVCREAFVLYLQQVKEKQNDK